MHIIDRKHKIYAFSPDNAPVLKVDSGARVVFETTDCYNGQLISEDSPRSTQDESYANPATGPLYIEGAAPGDTLEVTIESIELDAYGIMAIGPGSGPAGDFISDEETRFMKISDNTIHFSSSLKLEARPMIGVIGTAPGQARISTIVPDAHGGNMDCREIRVGSKVYLPVNVPGGLLSMGDLHALMGDGEAGGCGVEAGGKVTVQVRVIKNCDFPLPAVVTEDAFMCITSKETLDEAARCCVNDMHSFLTQAVGLEKKEANMLISAAGQLKVCQIVDPLLTVRMEIQLKHLEAYGYITE